MQTANARCVECGPCVAQLTSPKDRVVALQAALADESEPLVTLTHLLHLCRDEHSMLWEHVGDTASFSQVGQSLATFEACLPAPGEQSLIHAPVRSRLAAAFNAGGDVPPVVVAHALARLIDEHYGHTFADSFRRRSPYGG